MRHLPEGNWLPSVLGAVVLLAAVAIAGGGCAGRHPTDSAMVELPPADASSAPLTPPISPDAAYRTAVVQQIADALHEDRDQLAGGLRSDPRMTLMNLAKPLGIAQDQMAQIVLSALEGAANVYGRADTWTPQQVATEKAYWASQGQGPLIAEVSGWLRDG